jgi:hypothetical protein
VPGACRASTSENRSTTAREQSAFHHSCGYRRAYQALPNRRLIGPVAQQHGEHNRQDLQSARHRNPHSRARQSTRLVLATYPVSFYAPHLSPSPSPATRTIPQQKSTRYPFHCLIRAKHSSVKWSMVRTYICLCIFCFERRKARKEQTRGSDNADDEMIASEENVRNAASEMELQLVPDEEAVAQL